MTLKLFFVFINGEKKPCMLDMILYPMSIVRSAIKQEIKKCYPITELVETKTKPMTEDEYYNRPRRSTYKILTWLFLITIGALFWWGMYNLIF